jgi:hypothetical protein
MSFGKGPLRRICYSSREDCYLLLGSTTCLVKNNAILFEEEGPAEGCFWQDQVLISKSEKLRIFNIAKKTAVEIEIPECIKLRQMFAVLEKGILCVTDWHKVISIDMAGTIASGRLVVQKELPFK